MTLSSASSQLLQQKKSQKGNWELDLTLGTNIFTLCYNKRNPKKGIERGGHGQGSVRIQYLAVTTKEIPKRELRASPSRPAPPFSQTTKLQQKKSQKGNWEMYSPPSCWYPSMSSGLLQQKKSQKGNWEDKVSCVSEDNMSHLPCYNKRNPKKGIESYTLGVYVNPQGWGRLQQKKSQKGNWEKPKAVRWFGKPKSASYNKRNPKKGIERLRRSLLGRLRRRRLGLQQKKSQKGNWEATISPNVSGLKFASRYNKRNPQKGNWELSERLWSPASAASSYNKRNPKKGIEEWWKVG